jgi:hypothetical protein
MIRKRTTLILGAGASAPYGFPLGTELRNRLLDGTNNLKPKLNELGIPFEDWEVVRHALERGQFDSIDEFLAKYDKHAELVKLAVAYWINFAETNALFQHHVSDH